MSILKKKFIHASYGDVGQVNSGVKKSNKTESEHKMI